MQNAPDNVKAAFEEAASDYDRLRRKLIPCFDEFYTTAVDLLPFERSAPLRILDLGAGTGLLSDRIAERFPNAEYTLVDAAPGMLAKAAERPFLRGARVSVRVADYANAPLEGPWDAIVSALSIHHLPDTAKRDLYARIHGALTEGGIFVNADNVLADDPRVAERNGQQWVHRIRASGITEAELTSAFERRKFDILAPLGQQLAWLSALGFLAVDCAYKWHLFAVFSGEKAGDHPRTTAGHVAQGARSARRAGE